ncbi:hypothetical protein K7432_011658 [Basidiobolus ranarum]|uniref:Uncharacterized protein n=1 Tax=Basidiobolus ranarum TaxID=34480 RepID=A0ABR2WLZ3_9FUNG
MVVRLRFNSHYSEAAGKKIALHEELLRFSTAFPFDSDADASVSPLQASDTAGWE